MMYKRHIQCNTKVLLTGCFCIGPVIDSRLAVLDQRLEEFESRANTAD